MTEVICEHIKCLNNKSGKCGLDKITITYSRGNITPICFNNFDKKSE